MTSLNNPQGHILKDCKELYKEKLDESVYFVVFYAYECFYNKENYSNSSKLYIESVITDGSFHTWSNGVMSFKDVKNNKKYTTKLGHEVKAGKDGKLFVEVPKDDLIEYIC